MPNVLTVVSVMFLLSLVGAFVLFKLLKSAALIQRAGYQAGGALAGFLLIFGTLYFSYDKLLTKQLETETKVDLWVIVGKVTRQDQTLHGFIEVSVLPPPQSALSESKGSFRFQRVEIIGEQWPELKFDADGYYTETKVLSEEVADIDRDQKRIELHPVVLEKEVETTVADVVDLAAVEQEGE